MRIFVEILNIDGEHILSRNISVDNAFNVDQFYRFYNKLDDMVLAKELSCVYFFPFEKSKSFTFILHENEFGEYCIRELIEKIKPDTEKIIKDVCEFFRITKEELFLKSRKEQFVKPRQFATFLLWYVGGMSKKQSSYYFLQDHASGLNSINKALPSYYISNDPTIRSAIEYFSLKYGTDLKSYFIGK